MQVFLDHIGYVGITLLAGVLIGWKTYPMYDRLIKRLRSEDVRPIRVASRRRR